MKTVRPGKEFENSRTRFSRILICTFVITFEYYFILDALSISRERNVRRPFGHLVDSFKRDTVIYLSSAKEFYGYTFCLM